MFAVDVPHAKAFEVNGTAVLLDQDDRAGHFAGRNLVPDKIADTLQLNW